MGRTICELYESDLGVQEDMKFLLRDLHALGLKLGMLSNYDESLEERLHNFGIAHYFTEIGNSYRIGAAKPDERAFLAVLRALHCEPHRAVFIDDKEANVAVAQRLGMRGVVFESCEQLRRELTALGVLPAGGSPSS